MPTIVDPWGKIAAKSDADVLVYRGLKQHHLQQLERDRVDTTAYVTAQRFQRSIQPDSAAETRARSEENFIREKRRLLQTLAGLAMTKSRQGPGGCTGTQRGSFSAERRS